MCCVPSRTRLRTQSGAVMPLLMQVNAKVMQIKLEICISLRIRISISALALCKCLKN